jgi:hypothetical protein
MLSNRRIVTLQNNVAAGRCNRRADDGEQALGR